MLIDETGWRLVLIFDIYTVLNQRFAGYSSPYYMNKIKLIRVAELGYE
jgi:hypothetical protein